AITVSFTVSTSGGTITDVTAPELSSETLTCYSYADSEDPIKLLINTDEDATCKYSELDEGYDLMSYKIDKINSQEHATGDLGLAVGEYTYYARCIDSSGNESSSETMTFSVAPSISNKTAKEFSLGGDVAVDVVLSVTTSQDVNCKYAEDGDLEYDDMPGSLIKGVDADGNITHTAAAIALADIDIYTYYVRCADLSGTPYCNYREINFDVVASLDKNSTSLYATTTTDMLQTGLNTTLQSVGDFFIGTAIAQSGCCSSHGGVCGDTCCDGTALSENCSTANGTTTDSTSSDGEFLEEGSTNNGSGTGSFGTRLENLKPGTFFYARAYAVSNGQVYYGNQVGFQTADSCFVATAAFGSIFHPSVKVLRNFRDQFMYGNPVGQALINLYYRHSPAVADVISSNTSLRLTPKILLLPIIGLAWLAMHMSGLLW
ncbi:MAG: hypothetical protein D3923_17045, partial [Candidatus Electrothrix sp. AR3]|nr:hypothetical protein [Candidatus Electrothrix sp. AR3]